MDERIYRLKGAPLVSAFGDGTMVILDSGGREYFSLNATGACVWKALADAPSGVAELADAVSGLFDITPDECRADIEALLTDLDRHGLVDTDG